MSMSQKCIQISDKKPRATVGRDRDGWIVYDAKGCPFYDEDWRWNSRSVARDVARQLDLSGR